MKRAPIFIASLMLVFLMHMPVFGEGKIEVSEVTATKTHDADYMRYVRYQVEAMVKNHTNEVQEVAVTVPNRRKSSALTVECFWRTGRHCRTGKWSMWLPTDQRDPSRI